MQSGVTLTQPSQRLLSVTMLSYTTCLMLCNIYFQNLKIKNIVCSFFVPTYFFLFSSFLSFTASATPLPVYSSTKVRSLHGAFCQTFLSRFLRLHLWRGGDRCNPQLGRCFCRFQSLLSFFLNLSYKQLPLKFLLHS